MFIILNALLFNLCYKAYLVYVRLSDIKLMVRISYIYFLEGILELYMQAYCVFL